MPFPTTGGFQEAVWAVQSKGPEYASPGIVHGGSLKPASPAHIFKGIHYRQSRRAGLVTPEGSIQVYPTIDTPDLAHCALRDSVDDELVELLIHAGFTSGWDVLFDHAKIDKMTGSCKEGGALEMTFDFKALNFTLASAGVTPVEPGGDTFIWLDAAVTIGSNPYNCQSISFSVDNALRYQSDLDTKVALSKRVPLAVKEGDEKHEVSVELLTPTAWAIKEDDPAQDIAIVATFTNGTDVISFTWADLMYDGALDMPFVDLEKDATFGYKFSGLFGCLTIGAAGTPSASPSMGASPS